MKKKISSLLFVLCFVVFSSCLLVGCGLNDDNSHQQFNVNLTVNDSHMGAAYGSGQYCKDTQITIYAVSNEGYKFVRWSDGNTQKIRNITVNQNKQLSAIFETDSGSVSQEKYYLNSVSLYYAPYISNLSADFDEIYLFKLDINYDSQSLGGFNNNSTVVGYGNSILFCQKVSNINGYTSNNPLVIYTDASKRVLFDENQSIELTVNPYIQTLYSGGVCSPNEVNNFTVTVDANNKQTRMLCTDSERNYIIYVSFDFKLA